MCGAWGVQKAVRSTPGPGRPAGRGPTPRCSPEGAETCTVTTLLLVLLLVLLARSRVRGP